METVAYTDECVILLPRAGRDNRAKLVTGHTRMVFDLQATTLRTAVLEAVSDYGAEPRRWARDAHDQLKEISPSILRAANL